MASSKAVSIMIAGTLSAMLGVAAAPALAEQTPAPAAKTPKFYVGGGVGQSSLLDLSNYCNNQLPAQGVTVTSCDNKGFAWKGFGGYQFIRYFGVELGYYDFGKGNIKTSTGGQGTFQARGPYAGIVVTAPMIDRWSFIARAGALFWNTKTTASGNSGIASVSDNGINGSFGVGLEYMFTDTFGVRGELERFLTVGNNATTGQTNINMWSVSGLVRF